jgi:hypothetical protein
LKVCVPKIPEDYLRSLETEPEYNIITVNKKTEDFAMALQSNTVTPWKGWTLPIGARVYHFIWNEWTFCQRFIVPGIFKILKPPQDSLCKECLAAVTRYVNSEQLPRSTWIGE